MKHVHIHITGIVQGVGMRPFVYREAVACGVGGWVLNAGDGVHIEAHAEDEELGAFIDALSAHAPAAARIEHVEVAELTTYEDTEAADIAEAVGSGLLDKMAATESFDAAAATRAPHPESFRIIASEDDTAHTTLVSPDIATCDDCLRELFDPADRRYHYPFINCTNCGPRFTIIRGLPYDRAQTSMDAFPMCPECAAEYADPLDRRFHAQPDACFECGPHIAWRERDVARVRVGDSLAASDAIIERCAELLASDGVVAIKGLGGFHLACRADSEAAVRELRRRKRRSNKPLAVMVRDCAAVETICEVNFVEREILAGSIRPIVLLGLKRRQNTDVITHAVAFDLPELGVMLPYTPLQHLLLATCELRGISALVMTSGNVSGAPIEIDDKEAWEHLVGGGIADALLGNDREILSRFDDSVIRVVNGHVQMVRRARGYAPQPVALPATSSQSGDFCILACGSEQKATFALTREQTDGTAACFISQHIGNLENAETMDAWRAARTRMEHLFDLHPTALACDAHPGYLSSQWAREQAHKTGAPLIEVQHHHAHIAAVVAEAAARGEHNPNKPVIGIALDGTGAGAAYNVAGNLELDGTIWGGEILIANLQTFERAAHLKPWPLPGGAASIRDPRRNALALLHSYGLLNHPGAKTLLNNMPPEEQSLTLQMIERGINCPLTSSMGRLLDAISAILGICTSATYEGEPAILLEAGATGEIRPQIEQLSQNLQGYTKWSSTDPSKGRPDAALTILDEGHRHEFLAKPQDSEPTRSDIPQANSSSSPNRPDFFLLFGVTLHHSPKSQSDPVEITVENLLHKVLDGMHRGIQVEVLALNTLHALSRMISNHAISAAQQTGIRTVALSGGVFMNRILLTGIKSQLEAADLTVLLPHDLPFNDGCIAYGQAAVARSRYEDTQMPG